MRLEQTTWSTEAFESKSRYEAWSQALSDTYGGWSSRSAPWGAFAATVVQQSLGAFKIIECVCDPCNASRGSTEIRRDGRELLTLQLVISGREQVRFAGETIVLSPGSILVWDSVQAMDFNVVERLHKISVVLPLQRVQSWLGDRWRTMRHEIRGDQGSARLLRAYLESLSTLQPAVTVGDPDALIETTIGLLVNSLHSEPQGSLKSRPEQQLERVRQYIREHLSDSQLSPASIASGCGISLRSLHALFEGYDTSVCRYLMDQRLECCRRDLGNPSMHPRKISDVALSWGFADVAHFSRRFKHRFGETPRAFCRRIARP